MGLTITEEDLKKSGIAAGSEAEKAILVDIAYAAKEYKEHPEKYKNAEDIKKLVSEVAADKDGKNPFVKDENTKKLLENFANDLIDRSVEIDKKDGKESGSNAKEFLKETSKILNDHELLRDYKIVSTVDKASKGVQGVLDGTGLTRPEAESLVKAIDDVKTKLDKPEHEHLGVKDATIREDFNSYLRDNEKAFDGVNKAKGFNSDEVNSPEKKNLMGQVLKALGEGGIMEALLVLASAFLENDKAKDKPQAQDKQNERQADAQKVENAQSQAADQKSNAAAGTNLKFDDLVQGLNGVGAAVKAIPLVGDLVKDPVNFAMKSLDDITKFVKSMPKVDVNSEPQASLAVTAPQLPGGAQKGVDTPSVGQ